MMCLFNFPCTFAFTYFICFQIAATEMTRCWMGCGNQAHRTEIGGGFLGRGQQGCVRHQLLGSLEERCNLPHQSPGRSAPANKWLFYYFSSPLQMKSCFCECWRLCTPFLGVTTLDSWDAVPKTGRVSEGC